MKPREYGSAVQAVSLFLDRHWDPIGVTAGADDDGPEPGTEYLHYAARLVSMLVRGAAVVSMTEYLREQATVTIGLGPTGAEEAVSVALSTWFEHGADPARLVT